MSGHVGDAPAAALRPAPVFDRICRLLALAGGLVLLAAASITVVSVLGRYFLRRPIAGDIELVAFAMGIAISLFMPYCQLQRGHVIVDIFTERLPAGGRALLDALGGIAVAAVAGVLAWRFAAGGIDLRDAGDESMVLRIPTWFGFVVAVPAFALTALAGLVTAARQRPGARR
ncbi:MAG: TRAP transporter small permease [Alphaproteobacteria bacterium]